MSNIIKDILTIIDTISNEKNINREQVFIIINQALEMAASKQLKKGRQAKIDIDEKTGEYTIYEVIISDGYEHPSDNWHDIDSKYLKFNEISNIKFDRVAIQIAKNTIYQKIKSAELKQLAEDMKKKLGSLLNLTVKRITKKDLYLADSTNNTFILPKIKLIPGDFFKINTKLKSVLQEIIEISDQQYKFIVSRNNIEFLNQILKQEIPEISEEVVTINAIAREPGIRSKIAVSTKDQRIDPVGACVGMRGMRVQNISKILNGERIDFIHWSDDIEKLAINIIAPVSAESIFVDEEAKVLHIGVKEDNLAQAIGKDGINAKLASQLIKWKVDIITIDKLKSEEEKEFKKAERMLEKNLQIENELSSLLVENGFFSVEDIAISSKNELTAIELSEEISEEIISRAQNYLLLEEEKKQLKNQNNKDKLLKDLSILTEDYAQKLIEANINNKEEVGDLDSEELSVILGIEEDKASEIIMEVRKDWFNK